MGNHKFRFSDMIPNAWFYKLRDMNSAKLRNQQSHSYSHHKSSSINTIINRSSLPSPSPTEKPQPRESSDVREDDKLICRASSESPTLVGPQFSYTSSRKSTKRRTQRKTVYVPSPRKFAGVDDNDPYNSCHGDEFYESPASEFGSSDSLDRHENEVVDSSFSCSCSSCQLCSLSAADVIRDVEEKTWYHRHHQDVRIKRVEGFDLISELELPPILTKPTKHNPMEKSPSSPVKNPNKPNEPKPEKKRSMKTTTRSSSSARRSLSRAGKVKIRGSFTGKRIHVHGSKSNARIIDEDKGSLFYSGSFAIVKASFDPEEDFRDSMLEMIVENNVRAPKDLEKLLACYLSLNSNQYHDIIIKAFMQIWFNYFPDRSEK